MYIRVLKYFNKKLNRAGLFNCLAILLIIPSVALAGNKDNGNSGDNKYNIVVVVINALRADHLGCYGYARQTAPNIVKFSQDSIVFERAIAQSYWTLPNLASLFTSKFLSTHNLDSRDKRLNTNEATLAEILKAYGYSTAAFTCGLDTASAYGLNEGFDIYNEYQGEEPVGSFMDAMPKAVSWLNKNKDGKIFLFLHSYDTHPPYKNSVENYFDQAYKGIFSGPPLDYTMLKNINGKLYSPPGGQVNLSGEDIKHIINRYDDCIKYADKFFGNLIDELKRLGLYDKTIVILCADHGEELGDRGTFNRFGNRNLYQEVIRVPLIIRYPQIQPKGKKIHSLVGMIDLMPTVLDLLHIPLKHDLEGVSLAAIIKTEKDIPVHDYVISQASADRWAILRNDGWKLLYCAQKSELYNINNDPLERANLIERNPDVHIALMKDFLSWRSLHEDKNKADNLIKLDPKLIENLKKAGYW